MRDKHQTSNGSYGGYIELLRINGNASDLQANWVNFGEKECVPSVPQVTRARNRVSQEGGPADLRNGPRTEYRYDHYCCWKRFTSSKALMLLEPDDFWGAQSGRFRGVIVLLSWMKGETEGAVSNH